MSGSEGIGLMERIAKLPERLRADMKVMNIRNSEAERQVRAPQRAAMSIDEFCQRHAVGRTTVYGQIKQGRLLALKVGKRTLITEDDAEDWLRRLPVIEAGTVS